MSIAQRDGDAFDLVAGLAGGFALGYAAVRAYEAARDQRDPAPPVPKDPRAYGRTRRALMLAGLARSIATLVSA